MDEHTGQDEYELADHAGVAIAYGDDDQTPESSEPFSEYGTVVPNVDGYSVTTADGTQFSALDSDGDGTIDVVGVTTSDGTSVDFTSDGQGGYYALSADGTQMPISATEMDARYPEIVAMLDDVPVPANGDSPPADPQPGQQTVPDPDSTDGGQVPENGDPQGENPQQAPVVQDGQVVGDPAEYEKDWFNQAFDGSCVPASIAQIVSAYTGHHYTDTDFIQLVNEVGGWTVSADGTPGMSCESAEKVLDAAGIPATTTYGDIGSLEQKLADGDGVMTFVDANPIWGQADNGAPDHMVVVSSIDESKGIVYLSDTGTPNGDEEAVPIATFMEAWQTSHCQMVSCDQSAIQWQNQNDGDNGDDGNAAPDEDDNDAVPDNQAVDDGAPDSTPAATPAQPDADQILDGLQNKNAALDLTKVQLPADTADVDSSTAFVQTHAWTLLPIVIGIADLLHL